MATTTVLSGIFIGKIFGVLCNEEDNEYYSHYGASLSKFRSSTDSSAFGSIYEAGEPGSNNYWERLFNSRTDYRYLSYGLAGTFFRKSIDSRPVTFGSAHYHLSGFYTNTKAFSGRFTSSITSGKTAFGAICIGYESDDANSYGVVPGNCFKGYLDTDFFRTVYVGFQYEALFDGGNFIYAGGGWAIGWDPSNSITIHG